MTRAGRGLATTAVVAALVCAGCAGAADDGTPSTAAASADSVGTTSSPLRVGLTEWTIALSTSTVQPGRLHLVVTNAGATEHDLYVRGRAGQWHTPDLDPAERAELTVDARPGESLKLWCAEPGHEAQGMRTSITVAG